MENRVQPVAVVSNLCQRNQLLKDEEQIDSDDPVPPNKKKKKNENLQTLKCFEENLEKREEARERRHQEKIEQQKVVLETYKEMMMKLLEKL